MTDEGLFDFDDVGQGSEFSSYLLNDDNGELYDMKDPTFPVDGDFKDFSWGEEFPLEDLTTSTSEANQLSPVSVQQQHLPVNDGNEQEEERERKQKRSLSVSNELYNNAGPSKMAYTTTARYMQRLNTPSMTGFALSPSPSSSYLLQNHTNMMIGSPLDNPLAMLSLTPPTSLVLPQASPASVFFGAEHETETNRLLEENLNVIQLMKSNVVSGKVTDNYELMIHFYNNLHQAQQLLSAAPISMPPLPIRLNTSFFSTQESKASSFAASVR
ncbi:hypothetical protein PROFUN_13614 [Planoprotostelium fungivorum]|uniref:Uncharacterized protein n=1 Tax=Planoprotostelium fungivorum TaxID=1890364 RepID=A0A2P6N3L9_9EUKA|nr:hypothetical protein PROFUN_13614 [Planoprotostelium fungivorum]